MLTKTEIETCCANLAQRFNALEATRRNVAQAFDTAIGRRLSALVENGLGRYNIPDDRNSADARFFSSNALKSSGCRCYFLWDNDRQTLVMGFCPANEYNLSGGIRYLQIYAQRREERKGADEVRATFQVDGLCNTHYLTASLRDDSLCDAPYLMFSEETRKNCNGNTRNPLEDYIRNPKDVQALVDANNALKEYERRLLRIAHLVEAASEVLSALESRFNCTEKERDERVRFIFGLSGECATSLATVYRVKLSPEPYATTADGSDAK